MILSKIVNDTKSDVNDLLNKQVSHELNNCLFYQCAQNWCDNNGYMKASAFFDKQAEEEHDHARKMLHFMQGRDIPFTGFSELGCSTTFTSLIDVIKQSYNKEKTTTESLSKILHCSVEYNNPLVESFIRDMLKEQIEEEETFKDLVAVSNSLNPNDKFQMLHLNELFNI